MSIWTIVLACLAVGVIVYFYPRVPWPGNIIIAIIACGAALIFLLNLAGINTGLHF